MGGVWFLFGVSTSTRFDHGESALTVRILPTSETMRKAIVEHWIGDPQSGAFPLWIRSEHTQSENGRTLIRENFQRIHTFTECAAVHDGNCVLLILPARIERDTEESREEGADG